jgi:hypothetical protein
MTREEKDRLFDEATAGEEFLPGLVADPVHYSLKWGIPLSNRYLKDLEKRKKILPKKAAGNNDLRSESSSPTPMTSDEKEGYWKQIAEAEEHLFRVDPVHYSIKWGIPLSKKYLKDLENRKKEAAKKPAGKK